MLSRISSRAHSSASASKSLAGAFDLRSTKLATGLTVAAVDLNQPIAHVSIAFRAGSRHESATEAGFAHRLRNALGSDSARAHGLTMMWQTGNIGAEVRASVDRENIVLSMSFPREHASLGMTLLSELAQPKLEPWDLEDANPSLATDVAHLSPAQKVNQLLHEAAFRNGPLGNSPFCGPHNVGAADFRKLQAYATSRLVAGECAVVGVNVDAAQLQAFFAEQALIREGAATFASSKYFGHGDVRREGCAHNAFVTVAGEAPALKDAQGVAAAAIVAKIAQKALPKQAVFYLPYADSGLMGFSHIKKADGNTHADIKSAVGVLKSLESKVTEKAFEAAKAAAKVSVMSRADSGAELSSSIAASILAKSAVLTPADVVAAIDGVKLGDAKEVARKAGARLSMGALGAIRNVPYVDEC